MGGLAIRLPGDAVLFSIKTVITRRGVTPPRVRGSRQNGRRVSRPRRPGSPPPRLPSPSDFLLTEKRRLHEPLCVNPRREGDLNGVPTAGRNAVTFDGVPL